jgi:hypothetical protein
LTSLGDEHIRGFDIAVYDKLRVRVGDGAEHVQEESQPRCDIEPLEVAMTIDGCAIDVLEHEKRLPGWQHSRVHELRDVRMRQAGKKEALPSKALFTSTYERHIQQLDGYAPFEPAVAPLTEPDRTHPSLADERDQGIGAHLLACESLLSWWLRQTRH